VWLQRLHGSVQAWRFAQPSLLPRLSSTGSKLSAKLSKCELAGFGHFVVGAAAGVLHFGLAAHVLVLQLSHFGLQGGHFGLG
jgi:hypothetical protein